MLSIWFAKIWRFLFWRKEDREKLDSILSQLDDDLDFLEEIAAEHGVQLTEGGRR